MATREGIQASREFGGFMSKFVTGPLEQAAGMLQDHLKYARWERQVRLMKRAQEFLEGQGLAQPTRALPLNVGVPLLEAATLEENDELQDVWARLLVNGADAGSGVEVRRLFVSVLQDFGVLEAKLLDAVVKAPEDVVRYGYVPTAGLPDTYVPFEEGKTGKYPPEPVQVGLWNIIRLGCVVPQMGFDGVAIGGVAATALGKALIAACTLSPRG